MANFFKRTAPVSEVEPELAFDQTILPPEYLAEAEVEDEDQPSRLPLEQFVFPILTGNVFIYVSLCKV